MKNVSTSWDFQSTDLVQSLPLPPFITAAKRLLERGEIAAPFNSMAYVAYESNIDFEIFKSGMLLGIWNCGT